MSHMQMSAANVESLMWERYDEDITSYTDNSLITTDGLLEQINVTRDVSGYLWCITSVDVDPNEGFLQGGELPCLIVQSAGHALYVFINGQFSRSAYETRDNKQLTYRGNINLRAGSNKIALLSVAVGLPNVGVHYELWNIGALGPTVLHGIDQGKRDLTWQQWSYQIGLKGEFMNLNSIEGTSSVKWMQGSLVVQTQQPMTWYMAYLDAPDGDEPLALDMGGMGKRLIWINGQSLGGIGLHRHQTGIASSAAMLGRFIDYYMCWNLIVRCVAPFLYGGYS